MDISKDKYFLLFIVFFFLLIHAGYYIKENQHARLVDTDNYMRLVRVEQLAETGDWYDSVIHRSNFPYGEELHWTRPLDLMLLAGANILTPFQGFEKGLFTWGIIISPLLGISCLLALLWATRSVMNKNSQRLLLILFIAQPLLLQIFLLGRPDHHSLMMLLFILLLGSLFRMAEQPDNYRNIILAGLIAALSFWVSVETICAIIMVFISLVVLWLVQGQKYSRGLLVFSISLLIFSIVFLFIERPLASIFVVEYDRISIVHLFVFTLAVLATYVLSLARNAALMPKILKSALVLVASGLLIWLVFPAFFRGPMVGVNQAIVPIWLNKVNEVQPLWSVSTTEATIVIGLSTIFLSYIIYLAVKKKITSNLNFLLPSIIGFVIFLPIGIFQIRMVYNLLVVIFILLAVWIDEILTWITNSHLKESYKPVLRVLIMSLFFLSLPFAGFLGQQHAAKKEIMAPDLKALSSFLNHYYSVDAQARTILTLLDFGPELLYRTEFNLIATPYHRNDQGILYNYQVMAADSFEQAQTMLEERSVDLLILSPASSEKSFYKKTADNSTVYECLIAGEKPKFWKQVDLPPELANSFIVYRINY